MSGFAAKEVVGLLLVGLGVFLFSVGVAVWVVHLMGLTVLPRKARPVSRKKAGRDRADRQYPPEVGRVYRSDRLRPVPGHLHRGHPQRPPRRSAGRTR